MQDQNAMNMNGRVRHFSNIKRDIQKKSILPLKLLDVAGILEDFLPNGSSSDGIDYDKSKGEA